MDDALLDLYSARLKALGARVKEDHPLSPDVVPVGQKQVSVKRRAPLCGSVLTLDVRLDGDGRVTAIGWKARCCALAEAATAIVVEHAPGGTLADFQAARAVVAALLSDENMPLPSGAWPDLAVLSPAALVPSRHGSTLLAFDTLIEAVRGDDEARSPIA